jgi:hypothetical protein
MFRPSTFKHWRLLSGNQLRVRISVHEHSRYKLDYCRMISRFCVGPLTLAAALCGRICAREQNGNILASLHARTATGPLRSNPVNGRYFTDDWGRPIHLAGSHTWSNLMDGGQMAKQLPRRNAGDARYAKACPIRVIFPYRWLLFTASV